MKNTAIILLLLAMGTIHAQGFTYQKVGEKSDILALNVNSGIEFLETSTSPPATNFKAPLRAKLMQIPIDYIVPKMNVSKVGKKEKATASGGKYDWIVHSDRDNNTVYDEPNGRANGQVVNFMERFYVIGETDEHLRLIQYDPEVTSSENSRRVNMKKAVYLGWIPKRNLLLWTHAVVIPENNIIVKGLVLHNSHAFDGGIDTYQQMRLYNSPTLEIASQNEHKNKLVDFLYVYDKKDGNYLVGLSPQLPSPSVATQEIIKGWMSGKNFQLWTTMLCIEPNSDTKAVAERKAKGIKASLFNTYAGAEELRAGKSARYSKIIWNDDQYGQGYISSWKRMPILSKEENNIYKTAVFTNINNNISNAEKVQGADYQLFVEVYAPMQIDQLEYPLFKHVLLLTDKELYDLELELSSLLIESLRDQIIKIYKEIIKVHYGSDISFSSQMTLGQAMAAITTLPATSELLNTYTLKDLEDPRKISDDELRDIKDYIENKLFDMRGIIGNPKYFFRSRDNTYYWVPLDVIP